MLLSANQSEPVHMAAVSGPPQAELHTDTRSVSSLGDTLAATLGPAGFPLNVSSGYSQEENTRITFWGHFAASRDYEILVATTIIMT